MTRPRRVRLGVTGLGRMGEVHARNAAGRCAGVELAGLFDPDAARAAALSARLGVPAAASFEALCHDSRLDGVIIAAPTAEHAALSLQAIAAGCPVLCEKPISLERAAIVAVAEAAARAKVTLQVGFNRRFDAANQAAAERRRRGELGEVYLFHSSQRDMSPPRSEFLAGSGGIFHDMGVHDFDAARFLVGEIVEVSAAGSALSDPGFAAIGDYDTAVVTARFETGALGLFDLSRVAGYGYESALEVMGAAGTVRVACPPALGVEWRAHGSATRPLLTAFHERYGAAFVAEVESFAEAILTGRAPLATGADALAAFDLAEAAARSARTGAPVHVGVATPPDPGATSAGPDRVPAVPARGGSSDETGRNETGRNETGSDGTGSDTNKENM